MKKTLSFVMCLCFSVYAYSQNVTGTVIDETDTPLPGVSVTVDGTTNGTMTDVDGKFTIQAKAGESIVFSFIGMNQQKILVGNQTYLKVQLTADASSLEEVVVVGYGTLKKSQLTGAISSVKNKDITDLPIANTQQALQGRVAGVDVMQAGSRPGSEPRVLIRGRRSFNASNDPLYVLDGIPLSSGTGDINPNDIQSMEVLKDASATAIYGARGANGVVLITSKRGSYTDKPTVFYDAYYGASSALNTINIMNGEEFAEAKREAYRATGNYIDDASLFSAVELESLNIGRSTDYVSPMLRTGNRINQQIGFSGGNEKSRFYMSFNYFKDKGVIYNQDYNRNVLRVNLDHKITNAITVGMSTFINYSIRNGENFNPLSGALRENPLGQPYNEDGSINFLPTEDGLRSNPLSEIVDGANIDRRKSNRAFSGIYLTADIIKGLTYRFNCGPDFSINKYDRFQGTYTNSRRLAPAAAQTDNFFRFNYAIENILNYNKELGKNNLTVTAVQSFQKDKLESNGISVSGIPSEAQQFNNLGNASIIEGVRSDLTESSILSYLGRVNYGFNDKYLLTLSLRADGASVFGANSKWGYFPAVAVAWNLSNENFLANSRVVDNIKVRASYGTIGNQAISPYQTQGLLSQRAYNWGDNAAFGYGPSTIGNPDLKWESSTTANLGVDFSLLSGRVYGTLEYYTVNTSDLLLSRKLPTSTGFNEVTTNVGKTQNSGFEGTVSTVNIDNRRNFKWTTDFTFFTNKEKIVELYNGKVDDIGNGWFIGQPLSVIFDYKKIGIWQTDEADLAASYGSAVGEIKILDANNDGVYNSDDRVMQGSGVPKFSGGITNRFNIGNFDFSFFVYARIGQQIRSNFHSTNNTLFGRYNNIRVDYWTPDNPTNEFPRPNQNQESPRWSSSMNIFDGSFVKVRNINLGYKFSENVLNKLNMQSLRVFASVQQPFIFSKFITKYSGIDPETDIDAGLNGNVSPATRIATVGLNVKF